jgi:hypothetical protein
MDMDFCVSVCGVEPPPVAEVKGTQAVLSPSNLLLQL